MEPRMPENPPVNVGDELKVKIEAVGEKGDGLARVNGFVLFVPGAQEGEEINVRVTRVLSKVGFADKIDQSDQEVPEEEPSSSEEAVEETEVSPEGQESQPQETPLDTEDF